ncbi:MAG: replicative DNA helicase, partial [Flavobacteriaceae bacterium]|nr:replicative DNA helicase [Flavobacteriaceae bacterium]
REDYYNKNSGINNAEFIIAKHRNGRTGFVNVNFTPETMHYSDTIKPQSDNYFEL